MTDRRPVVEERVADLDLDPGDAESGHPDPDGEQVAHLAPTRSTRTRPSALDLLRAFD